MTMQKPLSPWSEVMSGRHVVFPSILPEESGPPTLPFTPTFVHVETLRLSLSPSFHSYPHP